MEDYLITIAEAARLLGVCKGTLREWDINGQFKAVMTAGGHRRYSYAAVMKRQRGDNMTTTIGKLLVEISEGDTLKALLQVATQLEAIEAEVKRLAHKIDNAVSSDDHETD